MSLWIGVYLDKGYKVYDAIKEVCRIVEGAYSFLLISILDPDAMYVVKYTGTMVVGFPEHMKLGQGEDYKSIGSFKRQKIEKEESKGEQHKF